MKFIRIGLLQVDSIFDIMCQLQHRLLPADHDGRQATLQLHPDVTKLAAFAGGNPRLLEVLLAAAAAFKVGGSAASRAEVSALGLRQLLQEGLSQHGDFQVVLKNALCIARERRDETLRWATEDLQRLLAELLCDVMTQRPHKRADLLVVGLKQVAYDELMSKGDFAFCYFTFMYR